MGRITGVRDAWPAEKVRRLRAMIAAGLTAPDICYTLEDEFGGTSSPAPVYLALQKDRPVSDGISLHFGYELQRMYRRIGHASRT